MAFALAPILTPLLSSSPLPDSVDVAVGSAVPEAFELSLAKSSVGPASAPDAVFAAPEQPPPEEHVCPAEQYVPSSQQTESAGTQPLPHRTRSVLAHWADAPLQASPVGQHPSSTQENPLGHDSPLPEPQHDETEETQ